MRLIQSEQKRKEKQNDKPQNKGSINEITDLSETKKYRKERHRKIELWLLR